MHFNGLKENYSPLDHVLCVELYNIIVGVRETVSNFLCFLLLLLMFCFLPEINGILYFDSVQSATCLLALIFVLHPQV